MSEKYGVGPAACPISTGAGGHEDAVAAADLLDGGRAHPQQRARLVDGHAKVATGPARRGRRLSGNAAGRRASSAAALQATGSTWARLGARGSLCAPRELLIPQRAGPRAELVLQRRRDPHLRRAGSVRVRRGEGPRQGRKAASVTASPTDRESSLSPRHLHGPASALYLEALARRRRDHARLEARRARRRLRRREQVEVGARDGVPRLQRPHHVARVPVRLQNLCPNTRSAPRRKLIRVLFLVPPPVAVLQEAAPRRPSALAGTVGMQLGGGALASMEQLPRIMIRQSDWSCRGGRAVRVQLVRGRDEACPISTGGTGGDLRVVGVVQLHAGLDDREAHVAAERGALRLAHVLEEVECARQLPDVIHLAGRARSGRRGTTHNTPTCLTPSTCIPSS